MDLVVLGAMNKQIARRLGVVVQTVKVHRHRVMQKMAATSLADLIRKAGQLNGRIGTEAAV